MISRAIDGLGGLVRAYLLARTRAGIGTRLMWWLIPIAATVLGVTLLVKGVLLGRIILAEGGLPRPQKFHVNQLHPVIFAFHIGLGIVALLIGPWQISSFIRTARPGLHRRLGRIYVGLVFVSAGASFGLAPRLDTLGTGFIRWFSAALWIAFTILAVVAIRRRDITAHRRWMLRSYAFTYMALTFLAFTAIGNALGLEFAYKYPAILWLSFFTNVVFVEAVLWRSRTVRPPLPGGLLPART